MGRDRKNSAGVTRMLSVLKLAGSAGMARQQASAIFPAKSASFPHCFAAITGSRHLASAAASVGRGRATYWWRRGAPQLRGCEVDGARAEAVVLCGLLAVQSRLASGRARS